MASVFVATPNAKLTEPIEVPAMARARRARSQPFGVSPAKLLRPVADGFVRHGHPAFGHDLFDISVAQAEAKVQPNAMADDLGREAATEIQRF